MSDEQRPYFRYFSAAGEWYVADWLGPEALRALAAVDLHVDPDTMTAHATRELGDPDNGPIEHHTTDL